MPRSTKQRGNDVSQVRRPSASRRGGGLGSCCASCLTLLILIVLGVFLAVYLDPNANSPADLLPDDFDPSNFHPGDFIPDLTDFTQEDPFNASTPEEANRWRGTNGQGGLTLELVNALEEKWYGYFDTAVAEWDNGNPDVLTLSVSYDTVDPDCAPIRGKMKVCNGNYGDTRWKGINVVSLINDQIIESSAKMNEFYLGMADDNKRQYTMCHELGHGFGLPHTDENFNNRNTGECMDYTRTPGANKSPGPDNFVFLRAMYGTVEGWTDPMGEDTTAETTVQEAALPPDDGGTRRLLLLRGGGAKHNDKVGEDDENVVVTLMAQVHEAVNAMEGRTDGQEHLDGWKEIHRNAYGSLHSRDFGNGVTVKVSKLLATPEDDS